MSDPQTTRPDFPGTGGPPFGERSAAAPRPIGPVRRVLQAFGAIAGVQFLAAAVALLVLTSYRRAAADWLLRALLRHLDRPAEAPFGAPAMDGDLRAAEGAEGVRFPVG
ncbi:hypothetical protein [Actinomadura rifamycini]|uniref:hypothetical protein n=1 Tax=Actinomadura rifamycini TaxID=31962 RepID=UPI0012F75710|nr:hypothetical protein [Actinomadura rifamycini]